MPLVQTRGAASAQGFGEFAQAAAIPQYIEDLFSTYLYAGNSSTQTITNNLDLSNKGGLVWIKQRSAGDHVLMDTVRGANYYLQSNAISASTFNAVPLTPFTSTGFDINVPYGNWNASGTNYVSWTFREQPKFFDIVTYSGTGSTRTVPHNLGSVPGCMIIKAISGTGADAEGWRVYHTSQGATKYAMLQSTNAFATTSLTWANTAPTSTEFTVGSDTGANGSGLTFIAYLFANDAGGFGATATDNAITCGSFTANGAGNATVTLGYEPQWLMWKCATAGEQWNIQDTMRGFTNNLATDKRLFPDLSNAEQTGNYFHPTATGFTSTSGLLQSPQTYVYIAIRRGAMKVPTVGTSVFALGNASSSTLTTSFPVDTFLQNSLGSSGDNTRFCSRLQGSNLRLVSSSLAAEAVDNGDSQFNGNSYTVVGANIRAFGFQRASSFFDEVCFTGTGSTLVLNHNLAATPELIFGKRRTGSSYWILGGNFGASTYWYKNDWGANDSSTSSSYSGGLSFGAQPTSTTVTLDSNTALNVSAYDAVLWMWATCPGVSKVGTYTGTGTLQTIPCGFTAGARFVFITRVGVVGDNDAYVWDSLRGMTSGNDPYFLLNSTAAQTTGTNYVDTVTTGFQVTAAASGTVNVSGGSYIFLAIA